MCLTPEKDAGKYVSYGEKEIAGKAKEEAPREEDLIPKFTPDFVEADNGDNIVLVDGTTKAASFSKVIEHLTSQNSLIGNL